MRRTTVALLAALEALVSALVCFGIVLVPLMLLWAVHFGLSIGLDVVFRTAADVWLLGHGVDLTVQLDAITAARTGVAGAEAPFPITIALLGLAFVTVLFGRRIGRRAALAGSPVVGLISAVAVYAAVGLGAAIAAQHTAASPSIWQAGALPAAIMAGGVAIGALGDAEVRDALVDRLPASFSDELLVLAGRAWCIGTGSAFVVLGVAAIVVAWAVAADYGTIAGLYQTLGAGIDGGIAITVAELIALPNLVVWAAAWLLGPGFAIGAGSQVTPAGTLLGPVPGVPLAGALPADGSPLSALWLAVPVVGAFVGGYLVGRDSGRSDASSRTDAYSRSDAYSRTDAWSRSDAASRSWWQPLVVGVAAGLFAGAALGLAAWWSGGAVGPGRLAEVGPDAWAVAGVAAVTVAIGAVTGGYAARARGVGPDSAWDERAEAERADAGRADAGRADAAGADAAAGR